MHHYNKLANILTGLSLAFGFSSIILSLEGHFTFACWAIIFAVVFDGADGEVARKNLLPSEFGQELDSLVDVISFGVAPAILGYAFVYKSFHLAATLALCIYLGCSVFRLARYNVSVRGKFSNFFSGLPTTVSGALLASFILFYRRYTNAPPPGVFFVLVLILSGLMISRVKYANLNGVRGALKVSKILLFLVISLLVLAPGAFYLAKGIFLPELSLFVLFVLYLFSPLFLEKIV